MSKKPTWCADCDHVLDRKRHPAHWICIKFPRLEGGGFVAPKVWVDQEPYMRCVGINGGACPMFQPIPTGAYHQTMVSGVTISTGLKSKEGKDENISSVSE